MRIIAAVAAVLVICWLTLEALFAIARPPQVPDRVSVEDARGAAKYQYYHGASSGRSNAEGGQP